MATTVIPEVTRKRMVQLLQILKAWPEDKITSAAISNLTGWKDSLIRHDLWLLGTDLKGVSNGYQVDMLQGVISQALELENQKQNCCIVGLNRLGAALLDTELTDGSPFVIKAGFDSNLYRVEILRSAFPLYPTSDMNRVIKQEKIHYAILTVKNDTAQKICNQLVAAGITGIVNMTSTVLKVPSFVKVENISILNALNLVI